MRVSTRSLGTLAVSKLEGRKGLWLVLLPDDGEPKPLARFKGHKASKAFLLAYTQARLAAHAAGRSGI